MSLSKLELVGFKSFMTPVKLQFRSGITAILGPNGCGKTNIVDAVRWVLGEQSARQLRGNKMENVIFNGTQIHKPTGYALVNLTINNEKGLFPLDYSEIDITRKIYRSGISEYFINKTPCRLKDIKELFADTGTGSHSYAVIEQEMIEYVLNDAHGERRNMFEEASGIVKYRMRREEAKRKLKLTESDLIRLEDILEELGKQVNSLRYQMGKAKRYRTIEEKIRRWELVQLRKSLSGVLEEKRAVESELAQVQQISRREDTSLGEVEKRVEGEKLVLLDLENRNTELQNQRYEIRRGIQGSEEKVIQLTERRAEARRRIDRAVREVEEADCRLGEIAARTTSVASECETISGEIESGEESVLELGSRYKMILERMGELKTRLVDLKQTQLDFLQNQVRVKSSLEHFESTLSELESRTVEMREKIIELETETSGLESGRRSREAELASLQESLAASEAERERVMQGTAAVEKKLSESGRLLSQKCTELARLKSRHDLLMKMKENFEGFPAGARHVLKKGDRRVRGAVADLLKVEERFRPALEAVLGGLLDGIVIDSFSGALELVSELAGGNLGRARFIVEEAGESGGWDKLSEVTGMLGRFSSFVRVDEGMESLVEGLLGDVRLFEDVEQALAFMESGHGNEHGAVTLSGVYLCRGKGVYFSGSTGEELSLLGRSEEIERLDVNISHLQDEVSRLEGGCAGLRKEKETLHARLVEIEQELSDVRGDLSNSRDRLREVEREHIMKKEESRLLLGSLDEMESSRVEVLSKLEEKRLVLQMQSQGPEISEAGELESALASLQREKEEAEASLTERKLEVASFRGALERKNEEMRGLKEMERQFLAIVEQRNTEISASKDELVHLGGVTDEERNVVKEMLERERSVQNDLDDLSGDIEEKRAGISGMEKDIKARQAERDSVFARENEIRVVLSSLETRMKGLVDKGNEIYKEDFSCYLEGTEIPLDESETAITPEMVDRERRKLEGLGPVNLAAVKEYEEKKSRLDFLVSQRDDLVRAKEELGEAIVKINKRARKRFMETFEIVRKYFGETFQVLFEGGEAALALADGLDPLEADIVISARPKGKRLQDISLLSGGERALTSLALLFALYKAKPSPFCIFDEVDAPLDDANIHRFIRMLRKFQRDTQFIIITHNKRTMEVADTLYGVTMEEMGISRVVSVDLMDIEQVLDNRDPAAKACIETTVSSN